jgi:hypothetical protein
MFRKLIYWITYPYQAYKERQRIKKRLKELRERDPFIYR